ncbi:MAG: hypothetical protein H0W88_04065 [Parachlamydiaceae bacterium]|nr:hypothetical protein [Parachlamydiaceae bacterium]
MSIIFDRASSPIEILPVKPTVQTYVKPLQNNDSLTQISRVVKETLISTKTAVTSTATVSNAKKIKQDIELQEKKIAFSNRLKQLTEELLTLKKAEKPKLELQAQKNKEFDDNFNAFQDVISLISANKVDYTILENQFLKKAMFVLKAHPQRIVSSPQKNHLFRQVLHVGLKTKLHEDLAPLHELYQGVYSLKYAELKAKYALNLLSKIVESDEPIEGFTTLKEKLQLLNICKQRNLFCNYQEIFPPFGVPYNHNDPAIDKITTKLIENINDLDKPISPNVITLENGDRSFIFSGGWKGHYISYEFKKTIANDYEFIIHNRGGNNCDERFHGKIHIKKVDGKFYGKTRVPIRVSKAVLKNRNFISFLVKSNMHRNNPPPFYPISGKEVYDQLHKFLIVDGKGEIIISEKEKLMTLFIQFINTYEINENEKTKILFFIHQLAKDDQNFHSHQVIGSCGESNLTTTEKDRAEKNVHRWLKLYTLTGFVEEMKSTYLSGTRSPLKTKDCIEGLNEFEKMFPKSIFYLNNINKMKALLVEFRNKKQSEDSDKLIHMKKLQVDILKIFKNIDQAFFPNSPQYPIVSEIHEHLISEFEIDKTFEVHTNEKIAALRKKTSGSAAKESKIKLKDMLKIFEKIIFSENTFLDGNFENIEKLTTAGLKRSIQINNELILFNLIQDNSLKIKILNAYKIRYADEFDLYENKMLSLQIKFAEDNLPQHTTFHNQIIINYKNAIVSIEKEIDALSLNG